jgi:hypothetical protein
MDDIWANRLVRTSYNLGCPRHRSWRCFVAHGCYLGSFRALACLLLLMASHELQHNHESTAMYSYEDTASIQAFRMLAAAGLSRPMGGDVEMHVEKSLKSFVLTQHRALSTETQAVLHMTSAQHLGKYLLVQG